MILYLKIFTQLSLVQYALVCMIFSCMVPGGHKATLEGWKFKAAVLCIRLHLLLYYIAASCKSEDRFQGCFSLKHRDHFTHFSRSVGSK